MRVFVLCLGKTAGAVPTDVNSDATVAMALQSLGIDGSRQTIFVYSGANKTAANLQTSLNEGDKIVLNPNVEGGVG